jgi:hypothetical protein
MTKDQRHLPGCEIIPANEGGFIVMVGEPVRAGQHRLMGGSSFAFAGTLDECLGYIRDTLSKEPEIARTPEGPRG